MPRKTDKRADINKKCQEMIDGIILSDGYVQVVKGRNTGRLVLNQMNDKAEWLLQVQKTLSVNNIRSSLKQYKSNLNGYNFLGVRLETGFYVNFKEERDRWYIQKEKRIPDDISLSPIMLAHWYMGDGNLDLYHSNNDKKYYRLNFYTNSFEISNVKLFLNHLNNKYGYHFKIKTRNRDRLQPITVLTEMDDVKDFLKKTSPYKVGCFNYKWDALSDSNFCYAENWFWTDEEINILYAKYPMYGANIEELISNGKNFASIRAKANSLGLFHKKNKLFSSSKRWSVEEHNILVDKYSLYGGNIPELLSNGRTYDAIRCRAKNYGIKRR